MKLFMHPGSPNSRKPRAVARHLGLDVEEVVVDVRAGDHQKPSYLAINPNGKVPLLVDGERAIWESAAICLYLAQRDKKGALIPDPVELTRWVAWHHAHLDPPIGKLVFQALFAGNRRDGAIVESATAEAARYVKVLDGELARCGEWLIDGRLSIADFIVGASFTYRAPAKIPLDGFLHVMAWLARLDELESWRQTMPPG